MDLTHSFTVPAGIDETWATLADIASVATCFPGAQITDSDETSFEGTVKVKLGPIALVYKGSGEFVTKDESAHRMQVAAKGKDKRGNGTAGADVEVTMSAEGDSATRVEVVTDLNITGKPAQFGRGVMQDVSDKLLGQFVDCLAGRFEQGGGDAAADPAPAEAPTPAPAPRRAAAPAAAPAVGSDAIDLGATALPVLLRAYGPQIAAVLGWGLALFLLLRRRKG